MVGDGADRDRGADDQRTRTRSRPAAARPPLAPGGRTNARRGRRDRTTHAYRRRTRGGCRRTRRPQCGGGWRPRRPQRRTEAGGRAREPARQLGGGGPGGLGGGGPGGLGGGGPGELGGGDPRSGGALGRGPALARTSVARAPARRTGGRPVRPAARGLRGAPLGRSPPGGCGRRRHRPASSLRATRR